MVVDEDGSGLLITRRTIRTPIIGHVEDTKRVVPFSETIWLESEREMGVGEISGRLPEDFIS